MENTDQIKKDKLEEFKSRVERHDWYYMMSDDGSKYKSGISDMEKISDIAKELNTLGLIAEAKEIWDDTAPLMPYSNNKFKFPKYE